MESEFKNTVLTVHHEESVTKFAEAFGKFERDCETLRKRLKIVREEFRNRLKPAHGHPANGRALERLLIDFRRVRDECADRLANTCDRIEVSQRNV